MAGSPTMKTGERFGRLTVIELIPNSKNPKARCLCDCGKETIAQRGGLRNGHSTSCGCLRREVLHAKNTTHGHSGSRVYQVWRGILSRCNNPKDPAFENYGGRRIAVEWASFEQFLKDMGEPEKGQWIDRINNNGNYSCENCRWVSPVENQTNKRVSKRWIVNGAEYISCAEAAKALSVHASVIIRGCNGYWRRGIYHPPKKGWSSFLKYPSTHPEVFQ